jgi:hypothetical protein
MHAAFSCSLWFVLLSLICRRADAPRRSSPTINPPGT